MARVQMLQTISGGRGDGVWPAIWEFLECGEDEARHLVQGRLARWPENEPETAPEAAQPPAAAPPVPPPASVPPPPSDGSEDPDSPAVRAAKQQWVEHAVSVGCDPGVAASMTKADLIATYGNP
jgi:hypothetical protein